MTFQYPRKNLIFFFRPLSVSVANRDIDTAAKFIGAGAATVGVAGSGAGKSYWTLIRLNSVRVSCKFRSNFFSKSTPPPMILLLVTVAVEPKIWEKVEFENERG